MVSPSGDSELQNLQTAIGVAGGTRTLKIPACGAGPEIISESETIVLVMATPIDRHMSPPFQVIDEALKSRGDPGGAEPPVEPADTFQLAILREPFALTRQIG